MKTPLPKTAVLAVDPPLFEDQYRCFTIVVDGKTFGLPVMSIQTIFRINEVTPVPLCPYEILGLTNLRGKIVTALSLRRRLRLPPESYFNNLLAIGIEHRNESFALVIDEVGDVIVLDPNDRLAIPPHLNPLSASLTAAVYHTESGILPILDFTNLFDLSVTGADRTVHR
jgi:purine-binding chemotaxis protein CheW